jgi:Cupin
MVSVASEPCATVRFLLQPVRTRRRHAHSSRARACWGQVVDQEPIRLNDGDFIVFPQGDAHILSSAPGMRATPDMSLFARPTTPLPLVYELGGGGPDRVRIVCCFLGCDERPFKPLLAALPRVIHLSAAAHDAATGWLATLLNMLYRSRAVRGRAAKTSWRVFLN